MPDFPPSYFILGTQKGGTSTLHYWLSQNPKISLPKLKETHYFSHADRFANGLDWYYHWFIPKGRNYIRGEVDPSYLFFPETPSRIKALCPAPKFIIILRDPLKRAYSQYLMSVQRGYEPLDFIQALEAEQYRLDHDEKRFSFEHHSYLTRGNYSPQIQRYQEVFPDSMFLFLKFDDLYTPESRRKMYHTICDFIGVETSMDTIDLDSIIRQASTSRSTLIRDLVHRDLPIRKVGKRLIPFTNIRVKILTLLDYLNKKKIAQHHRLDIRTVPEEIKEKLNAGINSVQSLTHLDLDTWRYPVH